MPSPEAPNRPPHRQPWLALALAPLAALVQAAFHTSVARADDAPVPASAPADPAAPAVTAPNAAPSVTAEGVVSYPPAFFTEFAPQSALDMVRRVPGFSIDNGDDRRGFSGAGGNVLIDGARPSAKSQSLNDILARIPADQVARIDLQRGAQSTEAAGQTQVVNVIRRADDEADKGGGLWELNFERSSESGRITPNLEASFSGALGDVDYALGVSRYLEARPLDGVRIQTDASGARTGGRIDRTPRTYRNIKINGSATLPLFGGTLNLNAEGGRENFRTTLDSFGFNAAGAPTDSFALKINHRTRDREIGGDWQRAFGDITLKLIGLDRRSWTADDDTTTDRDATGGFLGRVEQRVRDETQETIFRVTLATPLFANLDVEAGVEAAYNRLDAGLSLIEDDGSGPVPVVLPSANVRVEEDRAEIFARAVWKVTADTTVETSLTLENAVLSQSSAAGGAAQPDRTLEFWKPSVQLTRAFGDKNQWRVRVYRDVGQLDFGDFASSADLNDARVAAGNPALQPDSKWIVEAGVDWRWEERGALSVTLRAAQVDDVRDNVPIVDPITFAVFDAPGNIGEGAYEDLEITASVPVDALIPGGLIEASGRLSRSSVTDPVTRRSRSFSGFADSTFDIEFRQDVPALKLAWGLEYEGRSESENFRLNERDLYVEGPFLSAFVETNALPFKVTVYAWNLTDTSFRRQRDFFAPTRAGGLSRSELRKREFGSFTGVEISGRF